MADWLYRILDKWITEIVTMYRIFMYRIKLQLILRWFSRLRILCLQFNEISRHYAQQIINNMHFRNLLHLSWSTSRRADYVIEKEKVPTVSSQLVRLLYMQSYIFFFGKKFVSNLASEKHFTCFFNDQQATGFS